MSDVALKQGFSESDSVYICCSFEDSHSLSFGTLIPIMLWEMYTGRIMFQVCWLNQKPVQPCFSASVCFIYCLFAMDNGDNSGVNKTELHNEMNRIKEKDK